MGQWLDDAIEAVYTNACMAGLRALRAKDQTDADKWYGLANHIEDCYPQQVQALRERAKAKVPQG